MPLPLLCGIVYEHNLRDHYMDPVLLEKKSRQIRCDIVKAIISSGKGHIGGALSSVDILVALYYGGILQVSASEPRNSNRDRFLLGKGHCSVALYAVLADLKFFPAKEMQHINRGCLLGEHPDPRIPGIEVISGSLGQALGIATGMMLAARLDGNNHLCVVLMGDGECYEGSVWEAAQLAGHHQLNRLIVIIDRNGLCIRGNTEEINRMDPLADKWRSFGWEVREVDGHNMKALLEELCDIRVRSGQPLALIAKTIKGKGISFMENQPSWHHGGFNAQNRTIARKEVCL